MVIEVHSAWMTDWQIHTASVCTDSVHVAYASNDIHLISTVNINKWIRDMIFRPARKQWTKQKQGPRLFIGVSSFFPSSPDRR
jgi:hypothetical protein